MHTNRPKIKVPLESLDIILELLILAILVTLWGYVIMYYSSLPEIVPTHFNGKGEVDATGGKVSIWFLMAITTVITIGIHVLTKYPHIHNYMVEITEKNAAYHYKISSRLLRFVNFFTLLIMTYVCYAVIAKSMNKEVLLESSFVYIIIAFSVGMPILLIVYLSKKKKDELSKK